jgi:hypothetical protein
VPGVKQVENQAFDQFVVTYDGNKTEAEMIEACEKAMQALGYGVKI